MFGKEDFEGMIAEFKAAGINPSHLVLAVKDDVVLHAVGYESEPIGDNMVDLIEELADDEELGMVGLVYGTDYFFEVLQLPETTSVN